MFSGGVREALFGDENYTVMWGKRSGFAKVALQANVVSTALPALLKKNHTICICVGRIKWLVLCLVYILNYYTKGHYLY